MKIEELKDLIEKSKKIVFFGGAGVSTESGLKDFRGNKGLYNETFYDYKPEELLSSTFLYNNPKVFYEYYRKNFITKGIKPNDAHYYLAELENKGKDITVITQNIDGLHQLAGSKNVIELHGSIYRNYTINTKKRVDGIEHILKTKDIPYDENGEMIRPDVTLYGEMLDQEVLNKAINALSNADLLIVGGTSLTVYPAANLINYFNGKEIIAINRDYIPIKNFIKGNIGEIFRQLR